jgi:hypothetical protein
MQPRRSALLSRRARLSHELQLDFGSCVCLRSTGPELRQVDFRGFFTSLRALLPSDLSGHDHPSAKHSIPLWTAEYRFSSRECVVQRISLPPKTTDSHGSSQTAGETALSRTTTVGDLLFDPLFTRQPRPVPTPHYTIYPTPEDTDLSRRKMDSSKRHHPSSFQQLEKLGEGTYATVSNFTAV